MRTFGKLKTTIGISPYLTQVKHLDSCKAFSKVCLSNHDLMIEKGRHLKIDITQRFCPFCPRSIETELHILLHCKTYRVMREPLWSENTGHNRNFWNRLQIKKNLISFFPMCLLLLRLEIFFTKHFPFESFF